MLGLLVEDDERDACDVFVVVDVREFVVDDVGVCEAVGVAVSVSVEVGVCVAV